MKLNKFFALKTNFIEGITDEYGSGDPSGEGFTAAGGSGGGPVSLTKEQISEQLNIFNNAIDKMFPAFTDMQKDAYKRQAYATFLAQMEKQPGVEVPMDAFAQALQISPEKAVRDYTQFSFDDDIAAAIDQKIGGYTTVVSSAISNYDPESTAAALSQGMKSVFSGEPSWTPEPLTLEDIQVETAYDAPTPDQLVTQLDTFLPRNRQVARVTQNTPAYTVADQLDTSMFDAINFPERTINRGVPVVTKGIDAQGNPTTAITMGNAAASPSGTTIGDLDISAVLPSTGMGINADGTGTTTVGTLPTTGNIVASSADTLNMVDPNVAANPISTIDPNVLGLGGNQVGSTVTTVDTGTVCPMGTERAGLSPDANGSCNPVADAAAAAKAAQTADIQNLFTTSQTKDIASQRIGDYAASVGGLTAEEIAEAVTPVLSQKTDFGIDAGAGAADVLAAVDQFNYGRVSGGGGTFGGEDSIGDVGFGPDMNPSFITETESTELVAPTYTPQQAQERLQYLNTQDAAIGTGPYTETEAAMRGLDFARRNEMSLADAGAAFNMSEEDVRARADTLGIDLGTLGFADGGEVEDSRDAAVGSRLMAQAGIGSMQSQSMSPAMAVTIDRIMARRK